MILKHLIELRLSRPINSMLMYRLGILFMKTCNSMEHGPSREANCHWSNQYIPYLSWNLMFQYLLHKSPHMWNVLQMFNCGLLSISEKPWLIIFKLVTENQFVQTRTAMSVTFSDFPWFIFFDCGINREIPGLVF